MFYPLKTAKNQFLIQLYINGVDLNERDVFGMVYTDLRYAHIQEYKKLRVEKLKEKQRLVLEQQVITRNNNKL